MIKCDDKDVVLTDEQKARISLARALYSSAQILLLDDCLSDVDPEMGMCLNQLLYRLKKIFFYTHYYYFHSKPDKLSIIV